MTAKKKPSPTHPPAIKTQTSGPLTIEENLSSRVVIPLDFPFACPNLIRQRLIQDGPISSILYDTCVCRADHVPLIHGLEFDTSIQLTSHLNARQLVVIGIINSNLRQLENEQVEQSNELYEILQTLQYHLNYGRSQICSCRLATNDDYRCLIYDLAEATKHCSLQLIFGGYIFNGYGRNVQDLKKQLNHMRQQQIQQSALPDEFKFIFINSTPEVLANFDVLYDEEQACCELNDKDYREQNARGGIVALISKNGLPLGKNKQASAWR